MGLRRAAVAAIAALLLLGSAGGCTTSPPAPELIRAMTWNVNTIHFAPPDWAPVIAAQAPDVVALQEICSGDAEELRAILGRDYGIGYRLVPGPVPTSVDGGRVFASVDCGRRKIGTGAFGQALLTRLEVVAGSTVVASLPVRSGVDDDEPRAYLAATLRRQDGRDIRVVTTHLSTGGAVRGDQIAVVAEAARASATAVVLGDLNTSPAETSLLAPLLRDFEDVDRARNRSTSRNQVDGRGSEPQGERIDYLFTRGLSTVGEPETYRVTSSDHRPLVADLR
jgi:endonuclease/exonuclease/phosphatase family metal-dependent hydrolase